MITLLSAAILIVCSYSAVSGGRYKFGLVRGSRLDVLFDRLIVVGNVIAAFIGIAVPVLAHYRGPVLTSYLGSLCLVLALFLYPFSRPNCLKMVSDPRGRRAKPFSDQSVEEERWPYRACYWLGYCLIAFYLYSLIGVDIDIEHLRRP